MFNCPYKQCVRTFTRRAALREHLKTHEGEAYWERLTEISNINRVAENSERERSKIIRNEIVVNENDNESEEIIGNEGEENNADNESEEIDNCNISKENNTSNESKGKEIDIGNEGEGEEYITAESVRLFSQIIVMHHVILPILENNSLFNVIIRICDIIKIMMNFF